MSISTNLRGRRRRVARAVAAVAATATFGGLAAASAAPMTHAASDSAGPTASIFCWNEYDFTRSGNTVIASAFRDCTTYEVPQPLSVSIKKWYYDEFGNSGWITAASGHGVVTANCNPWWPTNYRHSITGEQIYC
jgi:hypothetical protein